MADKVENQTKPPPPPIEDDQVVKALKKAITELKHSDRTSSCRQFALEVDDILRRYVAETVSRD